MTQRNQHEHTFAIDQYSDDIQQITHHLPEIARLNENLDRSNDVPSVFHETIQKGIEDEQIVHMEDIFDAASRIPYDSIYSEYQRRAEALAKAEATATQAEVRLAEGLAVAKDLTAKRHDELDAIYQEAAEEIRSKREDVISLRNQMTEIEELFDAISPAWPIPQGMQPEDIQALYEMVADERGAEEENVDIIPVTPEERQQTDCLAEKAKHCIENRYLSDNIMFYLREREGQVVTVEDMIRFCYAAGVDGSLDGDHDYRSHITSALGPHSNGLKKQQQFNDEGKVLQYGWRYARENVGDCWVTRRRTRIYRVLDVHNDTTEELRGEINGYTVTDKWRTTRDQDVSLVDDSETPHEGESDTLSDVIQITHEHERTWEKEFIEKVDAAIEQAIEVGLFTEDLDEIRGLYARSVSGSAVIGTDMSQQKLLKLGYMRPSEVKNDKMTRLQLVINYLIEDSPELIQKETRRNAFDIVSAMVAQRLSELEARVHAIA